MGKLIDILKEILQKINCKNCDWSWSLSDGGKDPFTCHKCGYNNSPKNKEVSEIERTKSGRKVNKAYLTKNKSAMKGEIDRVAKLSNDDPSAYTKWKADYSDKDKKNSYKTKKSAATTAYEKRFGESL
jgi:hypothetical protein